MPLDIAIIGISCRFPGADDPDSYWDLLSNARSAITEVPVSRWDAAAVYDPDPSVPGKANTKWGGFLNNPGACDNAFFGLTPEEAVHIDPQQRLILELGWEALEDAGIAPESLRGSETAVYIGISHNDYERIIYQRHDRITQFHGTGSYQSVAAARLSYFLNITGPSMAIDTACSSTLSALHVACATLRQNQAPLALVGGITLHLTPDETIGLTKGRMLSGDGRCKSFDANANGYVRGEGGGVLVLKRVEDAVRDGDRLYGVIKGTAVNHNGRSNGLSAPSGLALKKVMEQSLESAGLEAGQVSLIEAHGTGTRLGDQIELKAMQAVYGNTSDDPLWLGCVKTNIGHLETASGMAGIIKVLMAMQHRAIPPNLHYTGDSKLSDASSSRLHVPVSLTPWQSRRAQPLAAVTAYGFGGANGHVLIEATGPRPKVLESDAGEAHLLCISARDEAGLKALVQRYVQMLSLPQAGVRLADICHTAAVGRNHFEWRAAFVANDVSSLLSELEKALNAPALGRRAARALRPSVWFGAVWPQGVAQTLARSVPLYGAQLTQVCGVLGLGPEQGTLAQRTFAEQHALAQTLSRLGITAEVFGGEGVGRLVAAVQAQTMTLQRAYVEVEQAGVSEPTPPLPAPVLAAGSGAGALAAQCCLFSGEDAVAPRTALLKALGLLYTLGAKPDWTAWYAQAPHRKVTLPTYPFQRKPYWKTFAREAGKTAVIDVSQPLSGHLLQIVEQHRLFDVPVAPGALYLSLSHAALAPHAKGPWLELTDVHFLSPMVVTPKEDVTDTHHLRIQWSPESQQLRVRSALEIPHLQASTTLHVGDLQDMAGPETPTPSGDDVAGVVLYTERGQHGIRLGSVLRWIETFRAVDGEVFATLKAPFDVIDDAAFRLHPGAIDSCFYILRVLLGESADTLVPVFIRRLVFRRDIVPNNGRFRCQARLIGTGRESTGFIRLYADDGLVLSIEGLRGEVIDVEKIVRYVAPPARATVFGWLPQPLPAPNTHAEAISVGAWLLIGNSGPAADFEHILGQSGADVVRLPVDNMAAGDVALVGRSVATRRVTDVLWFLAPPVDAGAASVMAHVDACLAMARQLAESGSASVRLHIMSVGNSDATRLTHESLESLARSVSLELPMVRASCWRLPAALSGETVRAVVRRLRSAESSKTIDGGAHAVARRLARRIGEPGLSAPNWRGTACLVTGASGELGQHLSRHLAAQGAQRLYLTGRRVPDTTSLRHFIEERGLNCELVACELDVTDPDRVYAFLGRVRSEMPILRGIFHLAGVLQDRSIRQADRADIDVVFAPKALGAWHLHQASRNLPLLAFVCFSSAAAILPSAGQSVYGAANAFLNGLCALRRDAGLVGQSVCWGPWGQAGMANQLGETAQRAMKRIGIETLHAVNALAALDLAMSRPDEDVLILACAQPAAVEAAAHSPPAAAPPETAPAAVATTPLEITEEMICALAVDIMELDGITLDPTLPLEQFGLDSLMGMELMDRLKIGREVPLSQNIRLMSLSARELVGLIREASSMGLAPTDAGVSAARQYLYLSDSPVVQSASRRVLCLPHLGGDAGGFAAWSASLGSDVDLRTVDWPRIESFDLATLAGRIARELCTLPPLPLHIYGHSMGGLLGYEVARQLDERHQPLLRCLTVGAMWSPDIHHVAMSRGPSSFDTFVRAVHEGGLQAQTLLDHDIWRKAAQIDWAMLQSYVPVATLPLRCDIVAVTGKRDPLVSAAQAQGWQRLCTGIFTHRQVPGGHLFIDDADSLPVLLQFLMASNDEQATAH